MNKVAVPDSNDYIHFAINMVKKVTIWFLIHLIMGNMEV